MSWTIVWATLGVTALLIVGIAVVAVMTVVNDRVRREEYGVRLGQGRE